MKLATTIGSFGQSEITTSRAPRGMDDRWTGNHFFSVGFQLTLADHTG